MSHTVLGRSALLWRPLRALRSAAYLCLHGEDDMIQTCGRNPNGGDNDSLRWAASSIAGGASPASS